eukprot:GHRR01011411.1.p4 GENE.GHRR01011411.1~~GHRR01011411.1.p4  ORF type:complete len:109 (+),score=43.67 GHRR01011411.1:1925-2251(+)
MRGANGLGSTGLTASQKRAAAAARKVASATDSSSRRGAEIAPAGPGEYTGSMRKHGSDAGLAGVAEAAGQVLSDLPLIASWRQEVLFVRMAAGITLTALLGELLGGGC